MKYYFPIHLDGGNRGCEAIAKSSAMLIEKDPEQLFGYCRNMDLDKSLGLDKYLTLIPCKHESWLIDRFLAAINRFLHTEKTNKWRLLYHYRSFLNMITKDDVVVSTGGDMMCYDNNEVIYTNDWLHQHGIKTILWGCSMGPENQTEKKLETLHRFSLIYTRESLTYEYFKSLGLKNVCLFPDPAFILPAEPFDLPTSIPSHLSPLTPHPSPLIGINISNYVMGGMSLDGKFGQEVIMLIRHILDNTTYDILLVPHVTWHDAILNQDDRQMAEIVTRHFNSDKRILTLDIDSLNYCQIRYAISKCKAFIGARTHAIISAYSMCVPAIALGYSIKSRGIAKDLGLDERLVVNSKNFAEGDLLRSFNYLMDNEANIREHLQSVMPAYKQKTYGIRELLKQL